MPVVSRWKLRAATLLFPPAGMWLLWSQPGSVWSRLIGTLGIVLYTPVYIVLMLTLMVKFTGLQIEWRGGMLPYPTYHKTVPQYDALEKHRSQQVKTAPAIPSPTAIAATPPYWTDLRGPARDGVYAERSLNLKWPAAGPKLLWKQPVGGGYAAFVVANGLAFTIEQRRDEEAVVAYEVETGREAWVHRYKANFQEGMGGDGPRATPTWHAGRIYSLGAEGDIKCLNAVDGRMLWSNNVLGDGRSANLMYGMSTSPLIVDDLVIVQGGDAGGNGSWVLAYDRMTGSLRWQAMKDKAAYASPMLVTLAGERQILVVGGFRAAGLSPKDGKLLWEFAHPVPYDNNIAQPIITGTNTLILSAGYGTGSTALAFDSKDGHLTPRVLWKNKFLKSKFSSAVLWQGHLYGLDEDILTCINAVTGERKWKDERYGYGQLLVADGHLIILSGSGELALVRATPEKHDELVRIPAIEGKTWNNVALGGGRLLIRNSVEMACYDLLP
ncbi:MAG TPA: PQQ-binding-like beta-propeller repeat protein [Roseimicrobium sp.]|nr:PQQ-binding-like beta-propeller repeat protein [Roseimicrobium sp.]